MARDAATEAVAVAGAITSMRIDELIANLATGIAEGQYALDQVCMEIATFMGESRIEFGNKPGTGEPDVRSLIELGFTPNFYQFVDTILEVRVAIKTQFEESRSFSKKTQNRFEEERGKNRSYEKNSAYSYSKTKVKTKGSLGFFSAKGSAQGSHYSRKRSSKYTGSSSYKQKSVQATTVDANYSSKYNYEIAASSLIKTKIVPIPIPDILDELIRAQVEERRELEQRLRWLEQSMTILAKLTSADSGAEKVQTDVFAIKFTNNTDTDNYQNANMVRDMVYALDTEFVNLTTDHWAMIGDIRGRTGADSSMGLAIARTDTLVDTAGQLHNPGRDSEALPEDLPKLSDVKDDIDEALTSFAKWIKDVSDRFDGRIQSIYNQLLPPDTDPDLGEVIDDRLGTDISNDDEDEDEEIIQ